MQKRSFKPFKEHLSQWRQDAGLTQGEVEARIEKGKGYISKLESGHLGPPGKEACQQLAAALGQSGRKVWEAAANDRLRGFDQELIEFIREEVREGTNFEINEWERYLLLSLRHIEDEEECGGLTLKATQLLEAIAYAEETATSADLPRTCLAKLVRVLHAASATETELFLSTMALWAEGLPSVAINPDSPSK